MATEEQIALRREWGSNVSAARKDLGLSQTKLAAAVDVSAQAIQAIEAGRAAPADQTRIGIARVLGMEVADLFPYPSIATSAGATA